MGRRPGTAKICVICGDKAKGINFGTASCMSCKAFFRRNALSNKELTCPFTDNCSIDIITRRFCTKCRLKKCFAQGMKKEWILSDEEREKIREKIRLNKIKRQEMEKGQQWGAAMSMNTATQSSQSFEASSSPSTLSNSSTSPPDSTTLECSTSSAAPTSPPADTDILASIIPSIFMSTQEGGKSGLIQEAHLPSPSNNNIEQQMELPTSEDQLFDNISNEILMPSNSNNSDFDFDYLDLDSLNSPPSTINNQTISLFHPSKYESILEFTPSSTGQQVSELPPCSFSGLYPDINAFPYQEMILPESCLLQELTSACSVLQNPYKRIQYLESFNVEDASRISQYMFHRLIRASKGLSAFNNLSRDDQGLMMKLSLLKMLSIRTVIMYNASRECWGFINDNAQANVLVSMRYIEPYCTKCGYQRHRNLPNLFRDEWKQDVHIFDLLTAIVLFTPRPEYSNGTRVQAEHNRYKQLLFRYLTLKYPTITEAEESFQKLLANVEEMFNLNDDIVNFMKSFGAKIYNSEFYNQLLDLSLDHSRNSMESCSTSIEIVEEPTISKIPIEAEKIAEMEEHYLNDFLWL